jgi:hypothetical protein
MKWIGPPLLCLAGTALSIGGLWGLGRALTSQQYWAEHCRMWSQWVIIAGLATVVTSLVGFSHVVARSRAD